MKIPVGSKQRSVWLPPPQLLLERVTTGDSEDPALDRLYEEAARYTIERFEAAGSPVVTDDERRRYHNFATYCVHGLPKMAPGCFKILASDGYTRRLLRLTSGPFRYMRYSDCNLDAAAARAHSEVFAAVRPASTFIEAKGFINPEWLVEVEPH